MSLAVRPPLAPMLAELARELPEGRFVYEPKWDGFRALIFRDGDEVDVRSRSDRRLARYFPEIVEAVRALPVTDVVLDGEIVVVRPSVGLDFAALMMRLQFRAPHDGRPVVAPRDRCADRLDAGFVGRSRERRLETRRFGPLVLGGRRDRASAGMTRSPAPGVVAETHRDADTTSRRSPGPRGPPISRMDPSLHSRHACPLASCSPPSFRSP